MRYLDRMQPLALVALRLTLGVIFIAHSSHKVYGHLHDYANFMTSLGIAAWLGYVSAFTEFLGGVLLILGSLTRVAAFALLIDMSVAIAKVHWKHGLLGNGGYEFPLALWTMAFALIFFGAGPISIDAIRGGGRSFAGSKPK
ncbi:MAG TPA: DoxX family protein [Terriglobales bacterium]|nr:DoxX family protein [Terriglobales bacterium]